jgi:23S rRNA (adenine2503-C2)-methyltransferase
MLRLLELTCDELASVFAEQYEKGPSLARALYREFYKNLNADAWQAKAIQASPCLAGRLRHDLVFAPGKVAEELRQAGVIKFVTELTDGHRIESVVLPLKTHQTLCVSSQVGCGMGCRFCETGQWGLARHLTVEEIVGQVYTAQQRYGQMIRNVVFMGMGEPFDNFENVIQAIQVLSDQRGLNMAQRRITLSTAGRVDGIEKLAALHMPHLNLTVSLNAPNDALRSELMPINKAAPLALLQKALKAYPLKKGNVLSMAYVLIPEKNDGPEHARQLADWLAPLPAKVNLIAFNQGKVSDFRLPRQEELDRFRQRLIALGVNVQKRLPRGRDLMAACGQLGSRAKIGKNSEVRSQNNPRKG